jgi:hypothetical protein
MSDAIEVIAQNEACRITQTSRSYEAMTGQKHEVWDRERGEKLSGWADSEALLERLDEADHRLTDEFREWLRGDSDA